jgi:hypothetical protein
MPKSGILPFTKDRQRILVTRRARAVEWPTAVRQPAWCSAFLYGHRRWKHGPRLSRELIIDEADL